MTRFELKLKTAVALLKHKGQCSHAELYCNMQSCFFAGIERRIGQVKPVCRSYEYTRRFVVPFSNQAYSASKRLMWAEATVERHKKKVFELLIGETQNEN